MCDCMNEAFINLGSTSIKEAIAETCKVRTFVVIMYDRPRNFLELNSFCHHLFVKKSRVIESLPPTFLALLQNALRAAKPVEYVKG